MSLHFSIFKRFGTKTETNWRVSIYRRKWESTINSFPQYKITIVDDDLKSYSIHFFALFSENPSAVPLLLLHGWPGSIVEFLPLLLKLRAQYEPESLPFHIIMPHYVGYAFSDPPPLDRDFTHVDNARLVSKLMHLLGFAVTGYVVQGGDLGSATAQVVASNDPACKLIHVNLLNIPPPPGVDVEADIKAGKYTPAETQSLVNTMDFVKNKFVFAKLNGSQPSTAGFVIGSSPLSLLAWLGEKMTTWTDIAIETDLVLTNVSMYWFSGCYPTSIYHHRLIAQDETASALTYGWKGVNVPFGYSWFRKELANPPKAWIDHTGKVSWYRSHEKVWFKGSFCVIACGLRKANLIVF